VTETVRVLVVDDSDDDAILVSRELGRAGFTVHTRRVDKQRELEAELREHEWDVVVADYSLPQLDALRTLQIVRDFDPNLPCIVVSGRMGEEAAVETMRLGAHDYVVKHRLARLGPVVSRALRDAEDRRRKEVAERALREAEARFRVVVDTATDAVMTVNEAGTVETFNPAAERLFGYAADEIVGRPISVLFLEGQPVGMTGGNWERLGRHRNGDAVPLEVSISDADVDGHRICTWLARDISERKAFEAQLAAQALHDSLTGVANRALLVDRLANVQSRAVRRATKAALLFIDLDHFKIVNDTMGHAAGDQVLRTIATRLKSLVRPADTVARFGGDEFVVLVEDMGVGPQELAERVSSALTVPIAVEGGEVIVSASIGVAAVDDPTLDAQTVLRNADAAMYRAKDQGRDRIEVFDHVMRAEAEARADVERSLREARQRGELRLHYQPQWSLRSGELVGFEALLRWEHPVRGLLGPVDFLTIADDSGLIVPIGAWALQEACRQAARWSEHGDVPTIWVNLSTRQLVHRDLVPTIEAALHDAGGAVSLGIEITEYSLMRDLGAAVAAARALGELGVRLAIDDFGTGYSSLTYVKLFAVDTLKIDRTFVAGIGRDRHDTAIVSAILGLARELGLETIGEGLESQAQVDALRALGCDHAQGYHLGMPSPADPLNAVVRREVPPSPRRAAGP
jgi:diguanylate cyclase (GGDEF)-like protein/PAS domain S-box-containing protein